MAGAWLRCLWRHSAEVRGSALLGGLRLKAKGEGKPWEKHGKMVVEWDLMGFFGIYPLVMTYIAMEAMAHENR